jgi:hypothetical protein
MRNLPSGRLRICLSTLVAVSALAMASQARASIVIAGADGTDTVDCRNTAPSGSQQNKCSARAEGGDVSLKTVDIHFDAGATLQVNGGSVDAISVGGGDASAGAVCVNDAGSMIKSKQISICRVWAQGGRVSFRNVQFIVHRSNGTTTTKRRDLFAVGSRPAMTHAVCAKRGNGIASCDADGNGAVVGMHHVDVVDRTTNTTTSDVDVSITGGDATANVFCGNSATTGSVQVNRCSATALGGDVALQDVRFFVNQG